METIIMGAGDIDQAHQPDEFISTAQLQPMVDVLRQLIQQLCITPQAA
jgi:acetylornithine deacetylase